MRDLSNLRIYKLAVEIGESVSAVDPGTCYEPNDTPRSEGCSEEPKHSASYLGWDEVCSESPECWHHYIKPEAS